MHPDMTPDRPVKKCEFCSSVRCMVKDRSVKFYCIVDYELEEVRQDDGDSCESFDEYKND